MISKEQGIEKKLQQLQIQQAKSIGHTLGEGAEENKADLIQKIFPDNETQNYEQSNFFMQLIQTFDLINYYNLILN